MKRRLCELRSDRRAAVAPTVALSLVALVAAGGIAFDYARMASLDTEMQNGADQAALAAATQLDQQSGAIARATAAANGLLSNQTLMANDNSSDNMSVATSSVLFYSTKSAAEADSGTNCPTTGALDPTAAGADAAAKFVCVRTANRVANFALTPIVAAFRSGNISAMAVAGLGSAICKVPPVMICNPDEPVGNTDVDLDFNVSGKIGYGLRLVTVGNGNNDWAPGNFGYLDTGSSTSNPNVELRQALGWSTAPGDCLGLSGVKTRTGAGTSVTPAINTRFDIYEKVTGGATADSCPAGSICPPSINTIKDVVRKGAPTNDAKCDVPKNNEWEFPTKTYNPTSAADLDLSVPANVPDAMGLPRDECHAWDINGNCSGGKVGNGTWDRNAYFKVNYPAWATGTWTTQTGLPSSATRYQVYQWEIAHRGQSIGGQTILGNTTYGSGGSARTRYNQPVCSQLQGFGSGIVPGGTNVDRRRISAAVLNCDARNVHGGGGTVYPVLKWIEMFIVEPSINRAHTDANDVYVEIIGQTQMGAGASAGQVVRRDVPYLVK